MKKKKRHKRGSKETSITNNHSHGYFPTDNDTSIDNGHSHKLEGEYTSMNGNPKHRHKIQPILY